MDGPLILAQFSPVAVYLTIHLGAQSRFSRPGWSECNISCSPDDTKTVFAVGCGEDLVTLSDEAAQWDLKTVKTFPSAIRAVDWLDRNVIIAGSFDSRVWLYDTRSQGSTARFQHGHAVQALKRVDEWKVIAAGPNTVRCPNEVVLKLCVSFDEDMIC